ncbi:hypothetical protein D9M71_791810 [compost metagenome]
MFLCMGDVRVEWVNPAPLDDLGGDHDLVRFGPTFHQTQRPQGCFWDHPVVHAGIGLFRFGAYPMEDGAFIILGAVVRT